MSFSKAKIKRFNDTAGCGPPVGAYNPKHPTDVKKEQIDPISVETNKCGATDENVPDVQVPVPVPVPGPVSLPILFTIASTSNTSGPELTDAPPRNGATCRSTTKRRRAPRPLLISKSNSSDSSSTILVNSTINNGTHTFHFSPNKTSLAVKQNSYSHFNPNQNNVPPHPVPVPVPAVLGLVEKNCEDNSESETENLRNIRSLNQGGRGNNDDATKELKLLNRDDDNNMIQVKFNNVATATVTEETNKGIEVRTRPFHGKRLKREVLITRHFGVETCINKSTGTTKHTEKTKLIDQKEIEQQLILTLKTNDELRSQLENVRADMDSLRTQSRACHEGFNELQLSLETERKNLLELRTKMKKTEAELNSSQISLTSCQRQLTEERCLHERTVQELKETEVASHEQLVKKNTKHIQELEIQLKEKVDILNRNQAEQGTVLTLISDLEMQIIAKDKEISDVTSWGNDWKSKYENNQNQARNVIGLGAAEVITLGAFSYFKWKYG